MKEQLEYYIRLIQDPEYEEFREEVKNFRKKWLNSNRGFRYSKEELELAPPLDINEKNFEFIWWKKLKGYSENFEFDFWQTKVKEELNLNLLIEDVYKNEKLKNYKEYQSLIKYEQEKDENGMFQFYDNLENPTKMNEKLMRYYNLFQLKFNYEKDVVCVKKWFENLKFKPKHKKTDNYLTKTQILKYEKYLDSLIYGQCDKYEKLKILSEKNLNDVNFEMKIYSEMFGYENSKPKIAGYKTKLANKNSSVNNGKTWIDVKINSYNTGKKLYNEFIKLMNKWSFEEFIISANYGIVPHEKRINEIDELEWRGTNKFRNRLIREQPFYLFLSNCILFDMNKVRDLSRFYRKINEKSLVNLNGFINQYVREKSKLHNILKLLYNDDLNKEDIIKKIESEEFKKKINNIEEEYSKENTLILSNIGKLPTKKRWEEIHDYQKKLGNTIKGSKGIMYGSMLEFYKWYIEIEIYGIKKSTIKKRDNLSNVSQIKKRFETYCKKLNLKSEKFDLDYR